MRARPGAAEVVALPVAVEDHEQLDRPAEPGDPVRGHRVELGGLPGRQSR